MVSLRSTLWAAALALVATWIPASAGEPTAVDTSGGRLYTVVSKVPIRLSGYVKLDASWDDSRTSTGNFARWVESEQTNKDDDEFNMTARQTRLALNFGDVEVEGVKTRGKVEVDFYGDSEAAENKAEPMLRHAFLELEWPDYDLELLAGQSSDVISPLNPSTVNYTVLWWNGNVGYRRPQVRLTKGFKFENPLLERIELQAAMTRNIGHDGPFDPGDTGEDAGTPGLQWRAAASFKLLTEKPTVIGVSGSVHCEEYDTAADDEGEEYESLSVNLDVVVPVLDWLTVKGELYSGQNVDAFLGGIGQGLNVAEETEIDSMGGWVSAEIRPGQGSTLAPWSFNLGLGLDDPDNDDLSAGDRSRNFAYYGNANYDLGAGVSAGLELMRLETDYEGQNDGEATRVQFAMIYSF